MTHTNVSLTFEWLRWNNGIWLVETQSVSVLRHWRKLRNILVLGMRLYCLYWVLLLTSLTRTKRLSCGIVGWILFFDLICQWLTIAFFKGWPLCICIACWVASCSFMEVFASAEVCSIIQRLDLPLALVLYSKNDRFHLPRQRSSLSTVLVLLSCLILLCHHLSVDYSFRTSLRRLSLELLHRSIQPRWDSQHILRLLRLLLRFRGPSPISRWREFLRVLSLQVQVRYPGLLIIHRFPLPTRAIVRVLAHSELGLVGNCVRIWLLIVALI